MKNLENISQVFMVICSICTGLIFVLISLYSVMVLFFNDSSTPYSQVFTPPLVALIITILLFGLSIWLYFRKLFIWSVIVGLPLLLAIIYAVYFFVSLM